MLPSDLVSPREAARRAGVSISSVYRWILAGHLRAYRRGKCRYVISAADVTRMIEPVKPRPVA